MKTLKMCFLFLAFVLIVLEPLSPCNAYNFCLGRPSDERIDFKPMEQYLEVKLISMNLPEIAEPPWYKDVFLHRKEFGLGYIEVTLGTEAESQTIKTMAFSYEKERGNRYRYKSLGISPDTPTSLSGQFPFPLQDQVQIRIVISIIAAIVREIRVMIWCHEFSVNRASPLKTYGIIMVPQHKGTGKLKSLL